MTAPTSLPAAAPPNDHALPPPPLHHVGHHRRPAPRSRSAADLQALTGWAVFYPAPPHFLHRIWPPPLCPFPFPDPTSWKLFTDKAMEAYAVTPTRPSHPAPTSPSPSSSSLRQWRTAAQRNLRNQWSRLLAAKARWLAAAADGRSHASALVNAHLSRRYMPGMDLGVLKDMPGIHDRASGKLACREEQCRDVLLSAYKEMVLAVSDLVKASRSMRCFSKVSGNSPLVQFTDRQDDLNDSGDGGGTPVFKWFSMLEFENLAQELVDMFVSELHLKRLLVLELLSINLKEGAEEHHTSLEWSDELYDGEFYEFQSSGLQSGESCPLTENWSADVSQARQPGHTPSHEVLQVYLTSWLANVNIKMNRIDEIFELVGEEIPIKLS